MTQPTISILTPSFNKFPFVMDAVNSVMSQTVTNWEYWIIDNSTDLITRLHLQQNLPKDPRFHYFEVDFTQDERRDYTIHAHIINQVYPEMTGTYIFYLSDDDIIYPQCFQHMIGCLESTPDCWVSYHSQQRLFWRAGNWQESGGIHTRYVMGKDTVYPGVDGRLDGGQIMHRRSCLDFLDYPFFPEDPIYGSHCDGVFMQKLAERWKFYPVATPEPLSAHRATPLSTWLKPPPLKRYNHS